MDSIAGSALEKGVLFMSSLLSQLNPTDALYTSSVWQNVDLPVQLTLETEDVSLPKSEPVIGTRSVLSAKFYEPVSEAATFGSISERMGVKSGRLGLATQGRVDNQQQQSGETTIAGQTASETDTMRADDVSSPFAGLWNRMGTMSQWKKQNASSSAAHKQSEVKATEAYQEKSENSAETLSDMIRSFQKHSNALETRVRKQVGASQIKAEEKEFEMQEQENITAEMTKVAEEALKMSRKAESTIAKTENITAEMTKVAEEALKMSRKAGSKIAKTEGREEEQEEESSDMLNDSCSSMGDSDNFEDFLSGPEDDKTAQGEVAEVVEAASASQAHMLSEKSKSLGMETGGKDHEASVSLEVSEDLDKSLIEQASSKTSDVRAAHSKTLQATSTGTSMAEQSETQIIDAVKMSSESQATKARRAALSETSSLSSSANASMEALAGSSRISTPAHSEWASMVTSVKTKIHASVRDNNKAFFESVLPFLPVRVPTSHKTGQEIARIYQVDVDNDSALGDDNNSVYAA